MKNKHLVLLFFATLLVGLAIRQAPWTRNVWVKNHLLAMDTASVQQLQIWTPNQTVLTLTREENGWVAEQDDRSALVSAPNAQTMLAQLADLQSIRIMGPKGADTMGFDPQTAIQITIRGKEQSQTMVLGWEASEKEQVGTYVKMPIHGGIYLTNKQLRPFFLKKLADFRGQTIVQFQPREVQQIAWYRSPSDSLVLDLTSDFWQMRDSTRTYSLPQVSAWLEQMAQMPRMPFADFFDESLAKETQFAVLRLFFGPGKPDVWLHVYRLNAPHIPEVLPQNHTGLVPGISFVLHSSQNPLNYFSIQDTAWVSIIARPF